MIAKNLLLTASGAALMIACVGIYGLLTQYIASRKQEWGLRLTFGASHFAIVSHLLRFLLWRIALWCVLGVIIGLATTTFLKAVLFGLLDVDIVAAVAVGAVVFVAALIAAVIPLKRLSPAAGPITELLRP